MSHRPTYLPAPGFALLIALAATAGCGPVGSTSAGVNPADPPKGADPAVRPADAPQTPPAPTGAPATKGADADPVWQGKPLSAWVTQLRTGTSDEARYEATNAINRLGPRAAPAVPALVAALTNRERPAEVCQALAGIGPAARPAVTPLLDLLKTSPEFTDATTGALVGIKPAGDACLALVAVLKNPARVEHRGHVLNVLQAMGPDAKDALPAVLDLGRADRGLARHVVTVLGAVGPGAKEGVPLLLTWLAEPNLTADAAVALGKIGDPAAVPGLITVFKQTDPDIGRPEALRAVAALGSKATAATKELAATLRDDEIGYRLLAADALTAIGPGAADAVPQLLDVVKQQNGQRKSATYTVSQADVIKSSVAALGKIGEPAVPGLVGLLVQADAAVRLDALRALAQVGPAAKGAVGPVLPSLRDPNKWLRLEAARVLRAVGPDAKDAVPALITALADADVDVQVVAIEALGAVGPAATAAVGPLTPLAARDDYRFRDAARPALKRIDPAAAARLGIP